MLNESHSLRAPLVARVVFAAAAIGGVFLASACSSDKSPNITEDGGSNSSGGSSSGGKSSGGSSNGGSGETGGTSGACTGKPASGAADAHCKQDDGGIIKQATGTCVKDADAAAPAPQADAGGSDYGETQYGTEGDDDDCKYHVSYTVPPICESQGVTFQVTVTDTVKGKPVTGAYPYLEATLNNLPSSSTTPQKYKETAPGVYDVGPIVFDKPGKWVARFHFFEDCSDEPEDSPHGHVAFYIQIP